MSQTEETKRFISTQQAAKLLGVSLRTVQVWVEDGQLKAYKTAGGHRRVDVASVQEMLEERSRQLGRHPKDEAFRVLVVEDDPHLRRLYEATFRTWGLPIALSVADNGYDGLVLVGAHKPDLAILDLNMPGMDGFRMIRSLRNNPATQDLKLVVVTGLSADDIRDRGGLPADIGVLTKPVPFSTLRDMLVEFIQAHGLPAA